MGRSSFNGKDWTAVVWLAAAVAVSACGLSSDGSGSRLGDAKGGAAAIGGVAGGGIGGATVVPAAGGASGGSATGSGGALAGGTPSTGGALSSGGSSGGATSGGGATSSGGAFSAGGSTSNGGAAGSGGASALLDVEPFASPSYSGSVDNGADCNHTYATTGFRPKASGPHPLFLYFVGTDVTGTQEDAYKDQAPLAVLSAMARRGYVALSVQYDNGVAAALSTHLNQFACLFNATQNPNSLLSVACSSSLGVDCGKGIATWGHSQGGALAIYAAGVDKRVRAAWATGVGGVDGVAMPTNRIRIVNGADDGSNNDAAKIGASFKITSADCPGQTNQCLRADGSGWMLVQGSELDPSRPADHCWFYRANCESVVDPNFSTGTTRISVAKNADWLAAAASTPWPGGL